MTEVVRALDPTRLVDAVSGWFFHGAGDYIDNHHYSEAQCGAPVYSINSSPYDPDYIGIQGEFGGIGLNASIQNLWPVWEAVKTINQTYEINVSLDSWRYRGHQLIQDLKAQIEMYSCSGAIWTQTTDVEGEVNVSYALLMLLLLHALWSGSLRLVLIDSDAGEGTAASRDYHVTIAHYGL